ncbi:PAN-1 domain [Plasmopara halstedii]|uniref:PAN-1 domain n=1 Tax=Plasmopara halstedii TaxID=4781 RepID=A0A0P1A668_PLAHL|nr:PAN-1 domain [Plasmopara halstedii]CEG35696.1 PAN-1 domain [Plasmopara halstedii]|eukprot:XP_024572065.1 PAN-1 domain [Plasmopara halstedii]
MLCILTIAVATFVSSAARSEAACPNLNLGKCGDASSPECCSEGNFCMPWTPSNYQCVSLPSQCSRQFTGYDFYGGDIKTVYGVQPGDCCASCLSTSGCLAYTFINEYHGTTACYLKAGMGKPKKVVGIVSAVIDSYTSDQDHTPKHSLQGAESLELLSV